MLTLKNALRAYAAMMNTLDSSNLEPLLAQDFHYASQMVFLEIETKQKYLEYINAKLKVIKSSNTMVWAEMGTLSYGLPGPCVVLAQGDKDELVAVVLAEVKANLIARIDLCIVPPPKSAIRSGDYPVRV